MEHLETPEPDPAPPDDSPTRRGFLGFMTIVLAGVPVIGGLFAAAKSGLAPAFSTKPTRIPLCRLEEIVADRIKEIAISYDMRRGAVMESVGKVVFVTLDPETKKPIAMSGECTHMACPVQHRALKIEGTDEMAPLTCRCHNGMFTQTGEPAGGPPKRPLRRLRLEVPSKPDELIYLLET